MNWLTLVSYFFGVARIYGKCHPGISSAARWERSFQSPFAKPPGKETVLVKRSTFSGDSSMHSWVICSLRHVGEVSSAVMGSYSPRFGLGALLISIHAARHFGQFHGGNASTGA